jgi:hypothetical protein
VDADGAGTGATGEEEAPDVIVVVKATKRAATIASRRRRNPIPAASRTRVCKG